VFSNSPCPLLRGAQKRKKKSAGGGAVRGWLVPRKLIKYTPRSMDFVSVPLAAFKTGRRFRAEKWVLQTWHDLALLTDPRFLFCGFWGIFQWPSVVNVTKSPCRKPFTKRPTKTQCRFFSLVFFGVSRQEELKNTCFVKKNRKIMPLPVVRAN
jgi:hypothetical protein